MSDAASGPIPASDGALSKVGNDHKAADRCRKWRRFMRQVYRFEGAIVRSTVALH